MTIFFIGVLCGAIPVLIYVAELRATVYYLRGRWHREAQAVDELQRRFLASLPVRENLPADVKRICARNDATRYRPAGATLVSAKPTPL